MEFKYRRYFVIDMSDQLIQVCVGASGNWIAGELALNGIRLQESLNDSSTKFMCLRNMQFLGCRDLTCCYGEGIVNKQDIELVAITRQVNEASNRRKYSYVEKRAADISLAVGHHLIAGKLHLTEANPILSQLLTSKLPTFFPVTEARVAVRGMPLTNFPTVLIRRDAVAGLAVDDAARSKPRVGDSNQESKAEAELLRQINAMKQQLQL